MIVMMRPIQNRRPAFLKIIDQQFELLDFPVQFLRGPAEARPAQRGKLGFEFFEMKGFGVKFGFKGSILILQSCCEDAQFIRIGRQNGTR